jgi:predicted kinase
MTTLLITIGPPASGKSTWAEQFFADKSVSDSWGYVNLDVIRWMHTGDAANQQANGKVVEHAHRMAREYAASGFSVLYDATNLRPRYRSALVGLYPWEHLEAHIFCAPLKLCLERNKDRFLTVPEDVVRTMYVQFQETCSYEQLSTEGFEVVIH